MAAITYNQVARGSTPPGQADAGTRATPPSSPLGRCHIFHDSAPTWSPMTSLISSGTWT